ncbi:hypothetical protein TgHK011_006438 [Trichoderma gracile]|nr:hypothetical protein TgHK011_006438 [Trichoderma gracile]
MLAHAATDPHRLPLSSSVGRERASLAPAFGYASPLASASAAALRPCFYYGARATIIVYLRSMYIRALSLRSNQSLPSDSYNYSRGAPIAAQQQPARHQLDTELIDQGTKERLSSLAKRKGTIGHMDSRKPQAALLQLLRNLVHYTRNGHGRLDVENSSAAEATSQSRSQAITRAITSQEHDVLQRSPDLSNIGGHRVLA